MPRTLFASLFLAWIGLVLLTGRAAAATQTVYAVWARPQAERTTALYYAARNKEKWEPPVQLPLHQGLHVTPVIAADRKGTLWIVWVEQTNKENILRYAAVRQGRTEKTGRICPAGNEQSYAPAILIDRNDMPWLAWSGVAAGRLADIYTSRWNGAGWEKPLLAHEQNQTPDIAPFLGLREGKRLWVSWFGMNEAEGRYIRYRAELENGSWRPDKDTSSIEETKKFLAQKIRIAQFPEQAKEHLTGAVFAGLDHEIQSVSDQLAAVRHTGEE